MRISISKLGRPLVAAGWVVLALAVLVAPLGAQQLTGNLYGYVEDEQGGRLPGVTVTLSGIGAPRSQTSDARGEYRFVSLDPGVYTLTFDLQGFSKVTKSNVQVAVGQNTNTSAQLKLSSVEASVEVQGESPLIDTRKVETGATIDQVELKAIPTARDPWVILQTVPGVQTDRVNVGGNESGQQTNYLGKGAAGSQNVWNIDGVTITDMGALGSSPDVLRLRLLRGDERFYRRQRRHVADARRAAEPRHEARNERHPRLRARAARSERVAVHQPARRSRSAGLRGRQPHRRGPGLRRRGRRPDHPRPALAVGRIRPQPDRPPDHHQRVGQDDARGRERKAEHPVLRLDVGHCQLQ